MCARASNIDNFSEQIALEKEGLSHLKITERVERSNSSTTCMEGINSSKTANKEGRPTKKTPFLRTLIVRSIKHEGFSVSQAVYKSGLNACSRVIQ